MPGKPQIQVNEAADTVLLSWHTIVEHGDISTDQLQLAHACCLG